VVESPTLAPRQGCLENNLHLQKLREVIHCQLSAQRSGGGMEMDEPSDSLLESFAQKKVGWTAATGTVEFSRV